MTLLPMSFYGAVLILAILLIRTLTLHKLPKKTFLVLWGVALLRLLVPFEISSGFSLYGLLPVKTVADIPVDPFESFTNDADSLTQSELLSGKNNIATDEPNGKIISLPLEKPAANPVVLLHVGTLLCGLFFLVSYIKCYREFRTSLPVTEPYSTEWLKKHSLKRRIAIRQSDKISAPLTYGIFRPVILLPKHTDWKNKTQLDYVLYHEFTHIRRFDSAAKLVMLAALCIHWFNPFVWFMYFFFNRDLELSCDDCVIQHFAEPKSAYAHTLIGMEEKKNYSTPLCNHFSKNAIEERITAIMKSKKTSLGMIIAAIFIVITVVITLTTGRKEPAEINTTVYDELLMYPPRTEPEWYAVVEQLNQGISPEGTTILPYDTPVPDYAATALHIQAQAYLAECGLGTTCQADCQAVCQTEDITVYLATVSSPYENGPQYFTLYHAYRGDELFDKVILRNLIPFYDYENLSHAWANYIMMNDIVQMAKEQFKAFCDSENIPQPYPVTSIHLKDVDTLRIDFLIPENENPATGTESFLEFTYDFENKTWFLSSLQK